MARVIESIFVEPPIAIARLGGSNTPQDAYRWVDSDNPRTDGNTVIDPWWTLDISNDGSVNPRMPPRIHLRDGDLIRPVAPFFELWAVVKTNGRVSSVPLTPAMLREFGVDESAIMIEIDAKNRKAARRVVNSDLVFGTFPTVKIRADDHAVHVLMGTSPPGVVVPMIPAGRNIPLGSVQIMRSQTQPTGDATSWEGEVDVEIIRFRFTPGRGRFYGPPEAGRETESREQAVEKANAILDSEAGWFGKTPQFDIQPADTFDIFQPPPASRPNDLGSSLGVVDDTCEARVSVTLTLPGKRKGVFSAHANIFVGPPDFAPDKRPFLSLADELNDRRSGAAERDAALSERDRDEWVEDFFQRVYETVSLFNLDHFQNERSVRLMGRELRQKPISGDKTNTPRDHAMTNKDALRNAEYQIDAVSKGDQLPLSEHAQTRHRLMQDIDFLKEFVALHPGRLEKLIRRPFQVVGNENPDASTMRMPPFMRNSNAFPLTLSSWQYDLLMSWVKSVGRHSVRKATAGARRMSPEAADRREIVLAQLDGRKPRR